MRERERQRERERERASVIALDPKDLTSGLLRAGVSWMVGPRGRAGIVSDT